MANSEFQYVRSFEQSFEQILVPSTWIVVRIDGRGFSKLCKKYEFEKPNDRRGIELMNAAAVRYLKLLALHHCTSEEIKSAGTKSPVWRYDST